MYTLSEFADHYHACVNRLRKVAFTVCNVPQDTPIDTVDGWLYERLATASNTAGPHFSIFDDNSVQQMIEHSLWHQPGESFQDKCAASLAEYIANPIVRHEILPPFHYGLRPDGRPLNPDRFFPADESGWRHESFGDVMTPSLALMMDHVRG